VSAAARWHNVQVHHYDDRLRDDLLGDCVRPLLARLAPRPTFFLRHWLRGPHVRLRIHTSAEDFEREVVALVEEHVGGWLAEHPSTVPMPQAALLAMHERLAARERETGPLTPFHPDNSIRYEPCDRRTELLGAPAAELIENFHVATTGLLLDMIDAVRGGTSRLNLALDLLAATAHSGGDVIAGSVSYRAHAEAAIMSAADPGGLRGFVEQQYRTRAPALLARLQQVLDTVEGTGGDAAFVRAWVVAVRRLYTAARPLVAGGAVRLAVREGNRWFPDEMTAHSPFHRALAGNAERLETMRTSPTFHTWRVLVNCSYLQLTRLGVRPFERVMLGYLLSRAVEDRFGVSAVDAVRAG